MEPKRENERKATQYLQIDQILRGTRRIWCTISAMKFFENEKTEVRDFGRG